MTATSLCPAADQLPTSAGAAEFAPPRSLAARLAGGLWRRWQAARGTRRAHRHAVDAALAWLTSPDHIHGLPPLPSADPCPALTAAAIPIIWMYGQDEAAVRLRAWLDAQEEGSGDVLGGRPIASIVTCEQTPASTAAGIHSPQHVFNREAVYTFQPGVARNERTPGSRDTTPRVPRRGTTSWFRVLSGVPRVRSLRERPWAGMFNAYGVKTYATDCTAALAQRIVQLYQAQDRRRADRLMARLVAAKAEKFHGWAAVYLLEAAQLQIAAAFQSAAGVHEKIDPRDGRAAALIGWAKELPPGARVADIGCGLGRYLALLSDIRPDLQLTGVDVAPSLLAALPDGVERCEGSLPRLPPADRQFDAVYTIETLEHCLVPERAVDELCRVVRPRGQVLIIDKHASHQPLSHHEPWERWFLPAEPAAWLSRHCDRVAVHAISHGRARTSAGLFLCWTGRRG